jgi:hypothetical protein
MAPEQNRPDENLSETYKSGYENMTFGNEPVTGTVVAVGKNSYF